MTQITTVKLALAASGLVTWGIGLRNNAPVVQYVGIALLVIAVLLRFLRKRDVGP
jgi:hypothetical protein